jgi:hypothetical protein
MNGNTPYAGQPGDAPAGRRTDEDIPELTPTQRRTLRAGLTTVAARTREFLPDEYVVGGQVTTGIDGPRATVAVQPPVGSAVTAGLAPDFEASEPIGIEERDELARDLAARAALQVKQAMTGDVTPVGG